ncbi:MFS general substrate transporter, partial [Suhomyces tanzawaensis NRRL Y-17324]
LETAVNDVYEAVVENDEDYDNEEHNEDVVWLREQRSLNKGTHWSRRPSVFMISVIAFFLALANTAGEGNRQIITLQLCCNYISRYSLDGHCSPVDVQSLMSNLQIAVSFVVSCITLVAAGKVGPMSDQYGRKVFLALLLVMFLVGRLLKLWVMSHFEVLQFGLMIACDLIGNIGGGIMCISALGSCYVTDVVEPHERIYSLGLFLAALLCGLSAGPLVGNLINSWASKIDTVHVGNELVSRAVDTANSINKRDFLPMKFELVLLFTLCLFCVFVLPESRSERARKKSRSLSRSELRLLAVPSDTTSSVLGFLRAINFLHPLRLLYVPAEYIPSSDPKRIRNTRIAALLLVVMDSAMGALVFSFLEIFILYGIYRFNWDQRDVGHLITLLCGTRAFTLVILSPLINHNVFQKRMKLRVLKNQFDMVDFAMAFTGFITDAFGYLMIAFAPTKTSMFIAVCLSCLGSMISPTLSSAIPKFYPDSKIGEVYGAVALLKNLLSLVTPLALLSLYKWSLKKGFPNLVFFVITAFL